MSAEGVAMTDADQGARRWIGRIAFGVALVVLPLWSVGPGAKVAAQEAPVTAEVPVEVADAVDGLLATMRIEEIIAILRDEGLDYGKKLEADMFPGAGGAGWDAAVADIYDTSRMQVGFQSGMRRELARSPEAIADMNAFFSAELGQRILRLEIEARRALLDDGTEEAAKLAWEDMAGSNDGRVALLERFATANDLVESNVMGALNANLAFYQGIAEGGAFGGEMTEDQMLADVWGQEAEVRQQVADWLFPYLALAYGPLSDDELEAYIAYSESPAGQQLNTALFSSFDGVFSPVSRALGLAVARELQGQDI
jgi:hypothetical protein